MNTLIKIAIFVVLFFVASLQVSAEVIVIGDSCSYNDERMPYSVHTFSSTREAEQVVSDILEASGLHRSNFELRAADVPNAAAVIQNGKRYLLYNPQFMRQMESETNSKWSGKSIMAHEIGHHLEAHTLDNDGSRPQTELEADSFSGFIIGKLGATLDEATLVMRHIGSPYGSDTHPARNDRVHAITRGWQSAHR